MSSILSISHIQAEFVYDQQTVKNWIVNWLRDDPRLLRLADIYDNALVSQRSSVVPIEWVFGKRSLRESNDVYREKAIELSLAATRDALDRANLLASDIDMIVSTSCTGFMIPSVCAHLSDALDFRPNIKRLPITEHGCAAGVVGLAVAHDHLVAHTNHKVLVVSVEVPSVTFQPDDKRPENIVSSALFGDGAAAAILSAHPHEGPPSIKATGSHRFPKSLDLMGFDLRDSGLHIVLSRDIPKVLAREAPKAIEEFLAAQNLSLDDIDHFVFHPGGRKILETFEETLSHRANTLAISRSVLAHFGNLSSATVLVVLREFLRQEIAKPGDLGLMVAFGPGFGAEMLLLEWPS